MILTATTGRTEWDFFTWLICQFTGPGLGNTVLVIVLAIMTVLTAIQLLTKRKPWTAIARGIGNAMNHDIIEADEQLREQMAEDRKKTGEQIKAVSEELHKRDAILGERLDKLTEQVAANQEANEKARAEDKAVQARSKIIRCADEVRQGTRHSKEMFDQVLEDITYYKNYCHKHDEFPNDKANASIKLIEDTYADCLKNDDFE